MLNNINNLEGYYANEDGEIFSTRRGDLKKLTPHIDRYGYETVCLVRNGKRATLTVHRLIAKTFIPNPENKRQVNHKNGVKTDNRIENLEWCTNNENAAHAAKMGLATHGERNCKAKITYKMADEIREAYATGDYIYEDLSLFTGLSIPQLCAIVTKRCWVHPQERI